MEISTLSRIVGKSVNENMTAFLVGMDFGGHLIEWHRPEVQAQVIGQVGHESLGFTYDREIWGSGGGTAVQKRYEDRADLGHSPAVAGEAFAFRGKGPLQVTGRYNHGQYRDWARKRIAPNAPDFEKDPEAILTHPWEGLSVVWYWETRNLTIEALAGNIGTITRKVNGGYNGYADRLRYYARAGLVLLGKDPAKVASYQLERGLLPDGIPGEKTATALHGDLIKLPDDLAKSETPVAQADSSKELAKLKDQLARIRAITEESA